MKTKVTPIRGWFAALLGGNANNGANAGFGYLNANNRPANSNARILLRYHLPFQTLYHRKYSGANLLNKRLLKNKVQS